MRKDEHQKHERRIIRDEIKTSALPQQAWEAWADPAKISQWFVDRAEGEAVAGGEIKWFFDKFNKELGYKVLEAVPGERYAILWPGPMPPSGILEVIIEREGSETLIRMVNSGFSEDAKLNEEYEGVVSGWHTTLALLREYLENYFGEARANILVIQPAQFEYAQVAPYFREAEMLAKWLTTSGGVGEEGEACKLALRSGDVVNGRVIARTKYEVAVSWPEARGTLELKSFSMGPQRMLGVRVTGWKKNSKQAQEIEKQMTEALARLAAALQSESAARAGATASDAPAPFWNPKTEGKS